MFSSTRKRDSSKNESLLFPSISSSSLSNNNINNNTASTTFGLNSQGFNTLSTTSSNVTTFGTTSTGFNSNLSSSLSTSSNINLNKLFSSPAITSPTKILKDTFEIPTFSIKERIRTPYKNNDDVKEKDKKDIVLKPKYYDNEFKTSLNDNNISEYSDTIKVFGLSLDNVSNILTHFSKFGEILRYEVSPLGGNWIIIQYKSEFGATHALSQNGILIDDTYMIGVIKATSIPVASGFKSKTFKQYSASSLLLEKPRTSICNEIMKYLFKW